MTQLIFSGFWNVQTWVSRCCNATIISHQKQESNSDFYRRLTTNTVTMPAYTIFDSTRDNSHCWEHGWEHVFNALLMTTSRVLLQIKTSSNPDRSQRKMLSRWASGVCRTSKLVLSAKVRAFFMLRRKFKLSSQHKKSSNLRTQNQLAGPANSRCSTRKHFALAPIRVTGSLNLK